MIGEILGHYEITGSLGKGGMGEVWRARDTTLGREVAIKTLPKELASDPDRLARFEREAKLLAALNHAHIATVYGLEQHEGTRFLAMELVDGQTLDERLKSGAPARTEALHIALQIAEALEAAHERGVVHRDLKPANIMVTRDGNVKVLDFGLAKAFAGNPNEASPGHSPALSMAMTQAGIILGTAAYMAPEQASGQATDQRADVWAFGVLVYEMLTGLPLFSGESVPHILAGILRLDPDWGKLPKDLHPRLKLMLERCLAKRPRDRYHAVADARVDIEAALKDPDNAAAALAGGAAAAPPPFWRRALPVAAAVVVTAGIVGGGAWVALQPPPPPIVRFDYDLAASEGLRNTGRPVIALSRDGQNIVYNSTEGLKLRAMAELDARLIPGTEEPTTSPFFSPDGQSVAYFAFDGGLLKRIAISGGAPVVIASGLQNFNGASWSADDTILIGQPDGIYRVAATGGTPELVIPATDAEVIYGPMLLPDGDSVLFSSSSAGAWDQAKIVVQSLATGARTVLVDGGSDAHYVSTGHLVYALGRNLFAIAFDPGHLRVSGGPVPLLQGLVRASGGLTATANYEIADNGTLAHLDSASLDISLLTPVWADRDGSTTPLGPENCVCTEPALSPDGTRVAFTVTSPGDTASDIWIWSIGQRNLQRLTFEPGAQQYAYWLDDARIAYTSAGQGLFSRPADGTGSPELIYASTEFIAASSLAGDDLLITERKGTNDIALVAVAGEDERRDVLSTTFDEGRATLSPDGRWLAYESNESGEARVYVRPWPAVESGKWQVSAGAGLEPHWSRDGQSLYYLGPTEVMEARFETEPTFRPRPPQPLFSRQPYVIPQTVRSFDTATEDGRVLMIRAGSIGNAVGARIVVVENWTEELERLAPTR